MKQRSQQEIRSGIGADGTKPAEKKTPENPASWPEIMSFHGNLHRLQERQPALPAFSPCLFVGDGHIVLFLAVRVGTGGLSSRVVGGIFTGAHKSVARARVS